MTVAHQVKFLAVVHQAVYQKAQARLYAHQVAQRNLALVAFQAAVLAVIAFLLVQKLAVHHLFHHQKAHCQAAPPAVVLLRAAGHVCLPVVLHHHPWKVHAVPAAKEALGCVAYQKAQVIQVLPQVKYAAVNLQAVHHPVVPQIGLFVALNLLLNRVLAVLVAS